MDRKLSFNEHVNQKMNKCNNIRTNEKTLCNTIKETIAYNLQNICEISFGLCSHKYWYLQLLQMANQDLLYFCLSLRNVTLPHKTSKYHLLCKKKKRKKKTVVNSNQSNYTRENYLHTASIIMMSNNGYLIPKICVMH